MDVLSRQDFVTSSIGHLENISSLRCADLPNVHVSHKTLSNITIPNITFISSEKSSFVKPWSSQWPMQVFQNSNFCSKAQILSWKDKLSVCSLKWQVHLGWPTIPLCPRLRGSWERMRVSALKLGKSSANLDEAPWVPSLLRKHSSKTQVRVSRVCLSVLLSSKTWCSNTETSAIWEFSCGAAG